MDSIGCRTLADLWSAQLEAAPDRRWLVFESAAGEVETSTYREFDDRTRRTARALHDDVGVRPGDHVALHLPNGPAYLLAWFGLLRLGAVAVHSNVTHTVRETTHTLDAGDVTAAIAAPSVIETVRAAAEGTDVDRIVPTSTDGDAAADAPTVLLRAADRASPTLPAVDVAADDPAQILFTSGTTSAPKGVVHTHANLVAAGDRQAKHVAIRADDRNATALPLYHVNAQTSALGSLTAGATFVLLEEYATDRIMDQLRTHRATITAFIGTQVRALLAADAVDDDNDLRAITFAINVDDDKKAAFEAAIDAPLLNGYGLTEAMSLVTLAPIHGDRRWPSVGRPTVDRWVTLRDADGDCVPRGETGEIAVHGRRGRTIFQRYYGLPEETAAAFTADGAVLTGDLGRFDEAGHLHFVDRKKNIIETRGENVSEREVEDVLAAHDAVEAVAVVGVPHEIYGEAVKAYVERDDVTADALRRHASEHLASFKVPADIEFVETLPRTGVGKVEKKALRRRHDTDA